MEKKALSGMWPILLGLLIAVMFLVFSVSMLGNSSLDNYGDKEACLASVQIRAQLPSLKGGVDIADFKSEYPLECKTNVVEINRKDVVDISVAEEKIADAMSECWYSFGKGDLSIFPTSFFGESSCVPCARIHLTDDAKEELGEKGVINIKEALETKMPEGFTHYQYLDNSGGKFSAFNLGNVLKFKIEGESFRIVNEGYKNVDFLNRLGGSFNTYIIDGGSSGVYLPEKMSVNKGDLIIGYGSAALNYKMFGKDDFGNYVPYLFYFQTRDGQPYREVDKKIIFNLLQKTGNILSEPSYTAEQVDNFIANGDGSEKADSNENNPYYGIGFCDSWEGIPA